MRGLSDLGNLAADAIEGDTVAFISWFKDGRLLTASQPFFKLTGFKIEATEKMKWPDDFATPVTSKSIKQAMEELDIGKVTYSYEGELVKSDGSLVPVLIYAHTYYDREQNKPFYYSFIVDLTELKQTKESLNYYERKNRQYLDMAFNPVWVNSGGKIAFANQKCADLLGAKTPEELIGMPVLDIIHPDYHEIVKKRMEALLKDDRGVPVIEEKLIRLDGKVINVEFTALKFIFDQKPAILVVIQDITERKRVQDALDKRLIALTEPLVTAEVSFTDLFNIEEIQKIQDAFAETMNVASIITNPDGTPITRPSNFSRLCIDIIRKTKKGCANCFRSDAIIGRQNSEGPIIQPCLSGGLWDAGASITVGGKHIANWLIGQVKHEAIDEKKLMLYASEIGADKEKFHKALQEVPVMSLEQFRKNANFLFILANELSHKAYQNIQQARIIAERKRVELELEKTNRALKAISRCNEAMIHIREESALLNGICEIFVDVGGYRMAWIGYSLNDASKTVQPIAKTGYEHGYIEKVKITWADTARGRGPAGTAIRTKKPSVVNNVMTNPSFDPWRTEAVKMGYASVIGLPLIADNQAFGVLTIYSDKIDAFDEGEIVLLQELADNLAFGIMSIRSRTERDQAEKALRESEENFRALAESSTAAIFVYQGGRHVSANQAAENITGYSKEELLKQRIGDFFHPDSRELVKERALARQCGKPVPSQYETMIVTKSGELKWVLLTAGRIMYRGKPAGVATLVDITERKRAEQAIMESSERLRLIMKNIPQRIFWKDTHSVYIGCNTNFALAAGVGSPENIAGKTDYDLAWTKAEAEAFRRDDREVMDNDRPKYHIIEQQLQADGRQAWLDTNKVPLHDAEGRVFGILGTYEDITDRKQAETQLKDAKAQAELYLDLMSHDITNMNQGLMGYLEMMEVLRESGEIDKGLIDSSIELINRSSRMINDVKKLTQVQAGKIPLKNVDVCKILSLIKSEYANVPGRSVTINYSPGQDCTVKADDLLKEVFENLVDNSIRHSTGPVTIDFAVDRVRIEGQAYYRITVSDTGPGIPDKLKKKIFRTLKEIGEKTERRGFGLYLVRTLIDRYQGQVWVEDRVPGDHTKGAKFVVRLPAVKQ